jgi:hypothetical protein
MPPRKLLSRPRRLRFRPGRQSPRPEPPFCRILAPPRAKSKYAVQDVRKATGPSPLEAVPFFWDRFTLSSLFVLQGTHHKRLTKTEPKEIHSEKARKALVLVQYQAKNGGEMARKWARISFFHACWPVLQGKSSRKSSSGEQPKRSCTSADPSLQRALDASHGATIPVP